LLPVPAFVSAANHLPIGVYFHVYIKANSKPAWVHWPEGDKIVCEDYNDVSIEEWHKKNREYIG